MGTYHAVANFKSGLYENYQEKSVNKLNKVCLTIIQDEYDFDRRKFMKDVIEIFNDNPELDFTIKEYCVNHVRNWILPNRTQLVDVVGEYFKQLAIKYKGMGYIREAESTATKANMRLVKK
jgi:hypothetical protein